MQVQYHNLYKFLIAIYLSNQWMNTPINKPIVLWYLHTLWKLKNLCLIFILKSKEFMDDPCSVNTPSTEVCMVD